MGREEWKTVEDVKNGFINDQLKWNEKASAKVISFIADFRFVGLTVDSALDRAEIIREQFRNGYCYYFAHILKVAFNNGEVCWAAPFGHFVWKYNNEIYDIEGVYYGEAELFIPETFMGDSVKDFKHVRGEVFNATKHDIDRFIDEYKQSLKPKEENILNTRFEDGYMVLAKYTDEETRLDALLNSMKA